MIWVQNAPLYMQLKQALLNLIDSDKLKPGDMLPSEQILQEDYSMSRTTVRMALKELELDGVILRLQGKGTFVSPKKIHVLPRKLMSYSDEMRGYGLNPSNRVLSLKKIIPPENVAIDLCIVPDEPVWHVKRLKLADDVPMALDDCYFPFRLARNITQDDLEKGSLYHYFSEVLGIHLVGAREILQARRSTSSEAKLLQISQQVPLFVVERVTMAGKKETPIEKVTTCFRSDRYQYRVKL